jgi:hypothetical protein
MTKNNDQPLWGIHAGATGEAHALFHNHNVVALGNEAFDSRYKGALPLKRVYVPEAVLGEGR